MKRLFCPAPFFALLAVLLLTACGTVPPHSAVPENLYTKATVVGFPAKIRTWGDEPSGNLDEAIAKRITTYRTNNAAYYKEHQKYPPMSYLAISGGGGNGAFGAGILCGWSEAGNRPEFSIVTGVSTGALIAPFVFAGPRYDGELKKLYTTLNSSNIYSGDVWTVLDGITGGLALTDNTPLANKISETITPELFTEIAVQHRKGRRLYIATSNLEAQRSVIWDIGSIANSGNPEALDLFRKIMLASAAVPGVFKPVFIDVTVDGKQYQEIHADGGITSQVFLYPLKTTRADRDAFINNRIDRDLYVIRNNKIMPEYKPLVPGLVSVSTRALETLTKYQGIGDLYRLYLGAERDGMHYRLAYIPADFREEPKEMFDPAYMSALFDIGFDIGKSGKGWESAPPGVEYMDETQ